MAKKVLFWTPRALSILLTLIFALFIFEGLDSWQDGLMHLLLTLPVLAITIYAWKQPRIGGVIFIILSVILIFMIRGNWVAYLIIGGIPLLTGVLYYISTTKLIKK